MTRAVWLAAVLALALPAVANACPTAPRCTPIIAAVATPIPVSAPLAGPCQVGQFSAPGAYPNACYTPYAVDSVWNNPFLPQVVDPNSAAYAQFYASKGMFTNLEFGYVDQSHEFAHPVYFGQASDPVVHVVCLASWAHCDGSIGYHIPAYANPAGGTDHHLDDVDQISGQELSCWEASVPAAGILQAQDCTPRPINGSGIGGEATGAGYALWAGVIRAQELIAGNIPHALFLVVPCTSDATPVFPSAYRDHTDTQCPGGQGAPYGAHMRLNMTDAEIAALPVPAYKKAIYTALARKGGFIGDTNGGYPMSIQFEADPTYTAAGYTSPDCPTNGAACTPLTAYLHKLGDPGWTGDRYSISLDDVDWSTRMQWLLPPAGSV